MIIGGRGACCLSLLVLAYLSSLVTESSAEETDTVGASTPEVSSRVKQTVIKPGKVSLSSFVILTNMFPDNDVLCLH